MAKLLDKKTSTDSRKTNTLYIEKLDRVQSVITGSASVVISASTDNKDFSEITTLTASGIYVPNGIIDKIYIRASAAITSGEVTITV